MAMQPNQHAARVASPLAILLALAVATVALADVARTPRPTAPPLIAILTYHDVADTTGAPTQTVTPDFLRRQIRASRSAGWTFLSLRELLAKRNHPEQLPRRVMVLTFDDGFRSFRDQALPVLHDERVPATLSVISSFVNQPPPGMAPLLTWNDLRALARDSLVEIISHSHDLHRYQTCNPYRDTEPSVATRRYILAEGRYETREEYRGRLAADLSVAQLTLTQELGRRSEVLAWPYGLTNVMAQGVAANAGFPYTLTVGDCEVSPADLHAGCLPRVLVTRHMRFTNDNLTWLRPPARSCAPLRWISMRSTIPTPRCSPPAWTAWCATCGRSAPPTCSCRPARMPTATAISKRRGSPITRCSSVPTSGPWWRSA
jgi:peptidoglycan/xylan/chitin deacetylase (PgdA/CDA1 family)